MPTCRNCGQTFSGTRCPKCGYTVGGEEDIRKGEFAQEAEGTGER